MFEEQQCPLAEDKIFVVANDKALACILSNALPFPSQAETTVRNLGMDFSSGRRLRGPKRTRVINSRILKVKQRAKRASKLALAARRRGKLFYTGLKSAYGFGAEVTGRSPCHELTLRRLGSRVCGIGGNADMARSREKPDKDPAALAAAPLYQYACEWWRATSRDPPPGCLTKAELEGSFLDMVSQFKPDTSWQVQVAEPISAMYATLCRAGWTMPRADTCYDRDGVGMCLSVTSPYKVRRRFIRDLQEHKLQLAVDKIAKDYKVWVEPLADMLKPVRCTGGNNAVPFGKDAPVPPPPSMFPKPSPWADRLTFVEVMLARSYYDGGLVTGVQLCKRGYSLPGEGRCPYCGKPAT